MFTTALRRSAIRTVPRVVRAPHVARFPVAAPARTYSTSPPSGGGTSWLALLAAVALGAAGGSFATSQFSGDAGARAKTAAKGAAQSARAAGGFMPTRADYQQVYNKIADIMDADYDGE